MKSESVDLLVINHALWAVILAAAVSAVSSHTVFQILKHSQSLGRANRRGWILLSAVACAAGVWSTHFVAMLGYAPDLPIQFDALPTFGSIGVIGVAAVPPLLMTAMLREAMLPVAAGGAFLGLGIAAMHYTGMAGVRLPGGTAWDLRLVAASIAGGVAFAVLALAVFARRRRRPSVLLPAVFLALATLTLHFTGMAAATIVPDQPVDGPTGALPRFALAVAISTSLILLLGLTAATIVAQRVRRTILQLRRSERLRTEQLHVALQNMTQGLNMYDRDNRLIVSNRRYCDMTGLPPAVMQPGRSFREILEAHKAVGNLPGRNVEQMLKRVNDLVAKGQPATLTAKTGRGRFISVHVEPMPSGGWVGTFTDVTEQKRDEDRIRHMAQHDALTGLPNRARFRQALGDGLDGVDAECGLAVMFLDLDGFKEVNDTLGHACGDALLAAAGARLQAVTRERDLVARLGGDEFAVIQQDVTDPGDAALLGNRLVETLSREFDLEGQRARISASVGIALAPRDGANSKDLLRKADIALYSAKAQGGGTSRFFEPGMAAARGLRGPGERGAVGGR